MLSETDYFTDDMADRHVAAEVAAKLSDQLQGFTDRADIVYTWLRQRESLYPYRIVVGAPTVAPQDNPSAGVPAQRTGAGMTTMQDNQIATYPPAMAVDSKGFQVPNDAITITESSGGTVATRLFRPARRC